MKNKKFFLGMAVLLGVSLFFLGCPSDPDDGGGGTTDDGGVTATEPTPIEGSKTAAELQTAIDGLAADGALALNNVTVTGGGVVNFGSAKATVKGKLATDADSTGGAVILVLADADVTFADGATIGLGHADDVAIVKAGDVAKKDGDVGTVLAPSTDAKTDLAKNSGTVAVKDYTLTGTKGEDDATTAIASSLKVYAYGNLVVPADLTLSVESGGTINIIGTVEVEDGGEFILEDGALGKLTGTVDVKDGGVTDDKKVGGGSFWADGGSTGKYVFHAGATAKIQSTDSIVASGVTDKGWLQLTDGTLALTKTTYTLDGEVTLINDGFGITNDMTLKLEAGSTLNLNASLNVFYPASGGGIIGAAGASIVITGDNDSSIFLELGTGEENTNVNGLHNFYTASGVKATIFNYSVVIYGSVTYEWNAAAGGGSTPGWLLKAST